MKARWKEDAQAVASKPQEETPIESSMKPGLSSLEFDLIGSFLYSGFRSRFYSS